MIYRKSLKRVFDIVAALVMLSLAALPVLVSSILIRLSSPGPVFFLQNRVGFGGRVFRIVKLRTMSVDPSRRIGQTTNEDPSVFPVGKVLRRLKIDELPQIFNVLKGDMSFVGPRPCLEKTRDEMPEWARQRFDVLPGVTGLAQINGNILLTWEERWKYDVSYVEKVGFFLDLVIITKTAVVVLLGEERFKNPV